MNCHSCNANIDTDYNEMFDGVCENCINEAEQDENFIN